MEPFKNLYNHELIRKLALDIQTVHSPFQVDDFIESTVERWDDLGLKERIYKISTNLGKFLPADYKTAICILDKVAMNYGTWLDCCGMFFTDIC